ncbi:odorant receptor 30a-like isoform X2 [Cylas formicarius]|uniref:odorant receptor 30a-like isoform X2 n=1 Tax=Cylas formicarius TaxID=197179 RepID=UPI00295850BC|nr:odorant receptor 30a-like isoform X2 [Cylas formicarius]
MKKMISHRPAQRILYYAKFCMIFAGMWRLELPTKCVFLKRLYVVYSAVLQVYFPIFWISICIQCGIMASNDNSTKSSEELSQNFSFVIAILISEIASILWQQSKGRKLIAYVIKQEKTILESNDPAILQCHYDHVQFCKLSNLVLIIFAAGIGASITLENYWRRADIRRYNAEKNASVEKPFAMELYYYKLDKEKHATALLVINHVSSALSAMLVTSTKLICFSCVIFVSSAIKRLQIIFRKISNHGNDASSTLHLLVLEHQDLIRFVKNLNDLMKYVILLDYFLNSLNVATVSIRLMSFEAKLISPLFFLSFLFIQIFVLGWGANEIKVQSLALADALYDSTWYEQNDTAKKALLTMIARTQRPLFLTIGPFDAMTMESALKIIKASYSYITLMKTN